MMRLRSLIPIATVAAMVTAIGAPMLGAQQTSSGGYLFGAPTGSLSVRFGYAGANAGSDLFTTYATHDFTLNRGDFGSFAWGADLAFALTQRVDLVFTYDGDGMEKQSEYRNWQDNSGNPIQQRTAFSRETFEISAKYYLTPYGRSLGRLAWVPLRYAPWVSAGIGRTSYNFSQNGDFIDFKNGNQVYPDGLRTSDWGTTEQLSAGVDWNLTPRYALTTQLRYLFGSANVGADYQGFQPIDLSGLGASAGFTIRF